METGLLITFPSYIDQSRAIALLESSDFHFEDNGEYLLLPEEPAFFDALEEEINILFTEAGIDAIFEGQF